MVELVGTQATLVLRVMGAAGGLAAFVEIQQRAQILVLLVQVAQEETGVVLEVMGVH